MGLEVIYDLNGHSAASAGDVNGDGFADVLFSARNASPNGNNGAGAAYLVFGKASGFATPIFPTNLNGTNGFQINGVAAQDQAGMAVASAGDVNGDGFADIIIGANGADPNGSASGSSYVIFGKASGFTAAINLSSLNGSNGFRLDGVAADDRLGWSAASAGDVNGDGYADMIVSAYQADPNSRSNAGSSYVVFGNATGFASSLNLASLNGSNGFRLDGVAASDQSGRSVASAGDMNGDGYDDLIIGAFTASRNGSESGSSYVFFGKASGFASAIPLSSLNGTSGFRLDGVSASGQSGTSVASAGDANGDGFADLIIGAPYADPNGSNSGAAYVYFSPASGAATYRGTTLADTIHGTVTADSIIGNGGNDTIEGSAGNDTMDGGAGFDIASYVTAGAAVTVDLSITAAQNTSGAGIDTLSNFEGLIGSAYDDSLTGSSVDNSILGGAGNDTMDGGVGNDTASYATAAAAVTVDLSDAGAQNTGGGGIDRLSNFESLIGSGYHDRLTGSRGNNIISGGAGNDTLVGGAGNDTIDGISGDDTLVGGAGDDTIDGGSGNDSVLWVLGDGNDTVTLGTGTNKIYFDGNAYTFADKGAQRVFTIGSATVTVTDWTTGTNSVKAFNQAPSITSGATASFTENGIGTAYTATGTDPDPGNTLTFALSGTDASLFNINAASGAVTFKNSPNYEAPADKGANNVYDITVTASDGTESSAPRAVAITVTNANDAPNVTSGGTASFAENATGTVYTATGSDADPSTTLTFTLGGTDAGLFNINAGTGALTFKTSPNFEAPTDNGANNVYDITVTASDGLLSSTPRAVAITLTNVNEAPSITSGATASLGENAPGTVYTATGSDPDAGSTLSFALGGVDAGLFSINASSGNVTFKATPNFEAPTDSGRNNVYDITVTTSDGGLSSAARAVAITITNLNEAPSITSGGTARFAENTGGRAYIAQGTDPDAGTALTYTLGGADAALFNISTHSGIVTFKATPDFETPADNGGNNVYDITVTTSDGSLSSAARAVAITVNDVDEAPRITSVATANFAENATSMAYTTTGYDPDGGPTLIFLLGGTDAGLFNINSNTGGVRFKDTHDFEAPADSGADNIYDITVSIFDGTLSSVDQAVAITVSNANEAPSVTSAGMASWAENATGAVYTATGSDPDADTILTFVLAGSDRGLFDINPATGVVTFKSAPDFEAPGDKGTNNVYDITVIATDGGLDSLAQAVTITVSDVNEAPSITSVSEASFAENAIGIAYTAIGSDADAGTILTYALGGTDAGIFDIDTHTGAITFKAVPNFDMPGDDGKNNVYDITVSASDGVLTSMAQAMAITITDVNEAPSITSAANANFAENAIGTAYTATGTDPDANTTLIFALEGIDAGLFVINPATGVVTFKASPDFEMPSNAGADNLYELIITTSDGSLRSLAQPLTIAVTDVNERPSITSAASASFAENVIGTVYTATGTDPDVPTTLTYTLGGIDGGLFDIDSNSGAVTFKAAPNFELPGDRGANNVYDFTVSASDGALISPAKAVAITITNLSEAPNITSAAAVNCAENAAGTIYTTTGYDPEGMAVTFALGGADAGLFSFNTTSGAISFKAAPNFEKPGDAGANNVYDLTITATDGGPSTAQQALVISVTDILEFSVKQGSSPAAEIEAVAYDGPVPWLEVQLPMVGSQALNMRGQDIVIGTRVADFINAGTGDDAVNAGTGDDVIDGGSGSNFLTGGAGADSFFVDGRAAATTSTWSTIADFQAGDRLVIWGNQPGVSKFNWVASAGASGYQGATLHCDLDGNGLVDTSVTFSGLTQAQLPTPGYGSVEGYDYIFIG